MPSLNPNKVYSIRITLSDTAETIDKTVPGSDVECMVQKAKADYPSFKRIIVFDPETKDVAALFKN